MQRPRLEEIVDTLFDLGHVLLAYDKLMSLPNCDDCAKKDCKYRPKWFEAVRLNCPLHEPIKPPDIDVIGRELEE